MATNRIVGPGQVLITAPVGGLAVGDAYFDNSHFGVCENAIAAGEEGYMSVEGCYALTWVGGSTPAKGAPAYWDPTAKKICDAWAAGRVKCGSFYAAAATDDATCQIMLDGGIVSVLEEGDITAVTAGVGLTGGGSTGSVSLAVAYGATGTTACVGNDARLSDARTPTAHAASHATAGTDAIAPSDIGACADNDARLSDARTPTAHAASHAAGQADVITPSAIGAQAVVAGAVENNLASFDATGSTKDSGITAASIAGAVTMGEIYNDNMRNSTNTAQSCAHNTSTIIDLEDVELVGAVTYAAGTTSLATIPAGASGEYLLVWSATFAAGAGTYNAAEIWKNGAFLTDGQETPDNANPITAFDSATIHLEAGDTIALYGKQDSGGALNVTAARLAIQRQQ